MAGRNEMDLAENLHKWAMKEMHFHPQGNHINTPLPAVENFREICKGPQKEIWKFVIENVFSAQTVKKVKGNLALKGAQPKSYQVKYKSEEKLDDRKQDLLEKRTQLAGELTHVLKDVNYLKNDLDRLEQEVLNTDKEYQCKVNDIANLRRKCSLLQTYSGCCTLQAREMEEYNNQMKGKVTNITKRAKKSAEDEQLYSRKRSSTDDDHYGDSSGLETKCGREVRKSCDHIGTFLLGALQGEFGTDKNVFHQKKQLLWKHVEDVLSENSIQQINNALITNTQNAAFHMKDLTSKVDIRKDAEQLRFKYENSGELTDLSNSPSLLQSVHELLEKNRISQLMRFIETEKYKNTAWRCNQQLESINTQIDTHLQKMFKTSRDLNLARSLVDLQVELASKRAELQCLSEEAQFLRESIAQALREKEVLFVKYQKIQDFKELANKKQELIQVIVRQNMNARSRLESQREEILKYIRKSCESHQIETKLLKTELHGYIMKEVEKFVALDVPLLLFSNTSDSALKVAVSDMSIYQTCPVRGASRESLVRVLHLLNFKPFQSPELLLSSCADLKTKIGRLQNLSSPLDKSGNEKDIVDVIKELCKKVSDQHQELLERTLPVIQQRINKTGAALSDCTTVKDRLSQWWELPAQNTVPWVKVDQNTLQQWKTRWTVLSTKYRQLLLQKS